MAKKSYKKTSKKTNGNAVAKAIGAVVIAGVLAAGICCTGFVSRDENGKWFGNGNISTWHWSDKTDEPQTEAEIPQFLGGMVVSDGTGDGFNLMSAQIPIEAYAENGLVGYADNAYTITATVKPDNFATNTGVNWELTWSDPESEWATGKSVTDYVTATPSGAGYLESKIVNVTCAQAFGEQVLLTATAKEKPEISAVCTIDYVQRLNETDVGLKFGDITCKFDLDKGGIFGAPKPGTNLTYVPVQVSAYGTEEGGMPDLQIAQSAEPYTIAGDYRYEYKLSIEQNDKFADSTYLSAQYCYVFGDYISDGNIIDYPLLDSYNVAEKGLYFGLKSFINMGLSRFSNQMSNVQTTRVTLENIETHAQILSTWWEKKGTSEDEGRSTWGTESKLFNLTLKVSGEYGSFNRITIFKVNDIRNTTNTIDGIELNPDKIYK